MNGLWPTSRHVTDCIFWILTIAQSTANPLWTGPFFYFFQKLFFFSFSFCSITVATSPYNPSPPLQDRQCYDALPWNIVVVGLGRRFPLDKGINGLHCSTLIDGLKVYLIAFVALFIYITYAQTLGVVGLMRGCVWICFNKTDLSNTANAQKCVCKWNISCPSLLVIYVRHWTLPSALEGEKEVVQRNNLPWKKITC